MVCPCCFFHNPPRTPPFPWRAGLPPASNIGPSSVFLSPTQRSVLPGPCRPCSYAGVQGNKRQHGCMLWTWPKFPTYLRPGYTSLAYTTPGRLSSKPPLLPSWHPAVKTRWWSLSTGAQLRLSLLQLTFSTSKYLYRVPGSTSSITLAPTPIPILSHISLPLRRWTTPHFLIPSLIPTASTTFSTSSKSSGPLV